MFSHRKEASGVEGSRRLLDWIPFRPLLLTPFPGTLWRTRLGVDALFDVFWVAVLLWDPRTDVWHGY